MCTSLTLRLPDGSALFGRTLDWHEHFDEHILRTPQGLPFGDPSRFAALADPALRGETLYPILGMGCEVEGAPLYADGMNTCGLCMAGLRFADQAHYMPPTAISPKGILSLAPWELIPYVLGLCATVKEARAVLLRVRVVDRPFRLSGGGEIPNAPLHWQIADKTGESLVAEATARGLSLYDAPAGVMSNAPSYPEQMAALERHEMEGGSMPAAYDPTSRFIRAAMLVRRIQAAKCPQDPAHRYACFFEVAARLSPPAGAVPAAEGTGYQTTLYTSCMDGERGIYAFRMADEEGIHEEKF